MTKRLFSLVAILVLLGCSSNSAQKRTFFLRSFTNKAELLANGFTQSFAVFEKAGKKQKVMMDHLYWKQVGDTTLLCGLNNDNTVKLLTIALPLKKTDTIALYGFLNKMGFEKEYRGALKPSLFITSKKEGIEYQVMEGKDKLYFERWLDTTKHPSKYPVRIDTVNAVPHQRK